MLNEKQILKIASDFFKVSPDRLNLEFKAEFGKSQSVGTYQIELPEKADTMYYLCGAFNCNYGAQINWLSLVERSNVYFTFNNPSDKVQETVIKPSGAEAGSSTAFLAQENESIAAAMTNK